MRLRVLWIALNTVVQLIKDRAFTGFFFVGIVLILGGRVIAEMSVVERLKMFLDTGLGVIFMVGVFVTLTTGSNIISREIRDREVLVTLSKPIPRSAWMFGKTSGFILMLLVFILALTTFLFFYVRLQTGIWVPLLFVGGALIFLEMAILSSYTILFSTITSQYLALFFGLMVLTIGHMVDDLKIYWNSVSAAAQYITRALYYIMPDFKSFLAPPVVFSEHSVSLQHVFFLLLYAAAYVVITVAIAVLIMDRKEIS